MIICREGSLICDLRLEFYKGAVEPLSLIEHAVADGSFTSIEVDRTYFKLNDYNEGRVEFTLGVLLEIFTTKLSTSTI